ncbi:MAG TPA: hypothetical protein VGM23_16425 [Armatimonadota bacterium]|jgi:hypothetical protein
MKQIRRWKTLAGLTVMLILGGMLSGAFLAPAQAISLGIGDVLKVGGIILVVSTFGGQINSFINNTLGQREAQQAGATKVVPIFSVGRGTYVGAAQVVGVPSSVRQVQGVAAAELSAGGLSGMGLFPITTKKAGKTFDTVGGVGVSAIIDFHI